MPNRTTAKGFPLGPDDECYVSRHLEGPDYKIHNVMRAAAPVTNGKRIFYAAVRPWLCNAVNQSGSAVDATLDRLEAAGWIVSLGRTRRPDGTETPNQYEIVEHAAWVAKHPGCCPEYKLAPTWDEARKHGVKKGERIKVGPLPKNFWPDEPVLRSALDKITSEEASLISEEELTALNAHLASFTTPGQPELATTTGQPVAAEPAPLPVNREWATPGQPVAPLPVNRNSHSRSTGKNLSKPTLVNQPDTHTPNESASVSVCVDIKTPSTMADQQTGDPESWVAEMLANQPRDWSLGPNQRPELKAIAKRLGREMFLAVGDAYIKEPPEIINNRTLAPWSFLAPNLEKYILRVKVIRERKAKEEAARPAYERTMKVYDRKQKVQVNKVWEEFLSSLPQEDRDYRAQVESATTFEELPPDNGKHYDALRIKFERDKQDKEDAKVKELQPGDW